MSIRWYLFAIANYIFILGHVFFLIGALDASAGTLAPIGILLFILCLAIFIFNSVFNVYIFHGYLPNMGFKPTMKRKYFFSTTLFIAAFLGFTFTLISVIFEEDISDSDNGFNSFVKCVLFLNSMIGLFILINQFSVINLIKKKTNNQ